MKHVLVCLALVTLILPAHALRVLEGRLRSGGEPVAGARVELVRWDARTPRVAQSDARGLFAFHDVPDGNYRLTADADGFAVYTMDHLAIPQELDSMDLRLQMTRGAIFSGTTIARASGEPLADAWVQLSGGGPERKVRTARDGSFRIDKIYPGVYQVQVSRLGMVPYRWQGLRLEGTKEATAEVALVYAGSLAGRMVFPEGVESTVFPGVRLQLMGPEQAWAVSDRDGAFRFDGLPPGTYRIMVNAPGFEKTSRSDVTLAEGLNVSGLRLRVQPRPPTFNVFTREQAVLPGRPFDLNLRAYRIGSITHEWQVISATDFFRSGRDPRDAAAWRVGTASTIATWSKTLGYTRPYTWYEGAINMKAQAPGLYLLSSRVEDVTDSLLVVVTQLGLVCKSSAGGVLVYAADLATGRRVADIPVRLVED